jgi:amino acid transporter
VPKVGPGAFILLLFVTPGLVGLPTAFATAELSARRSVAGGYYKWTRSTSATFIRSFSADRRRGNGVTWLSR